MLASRVARVCVAVLLCLSFVTGVTANDGNNDNNNSGNDNGSNSSSKESGDIASKKNVVIPLTEEQIIEQKLIPAMKKAPKKESVSVYRAMGILERSQKYTHTHAAFSVLLRYRKYETVVAGINRVFQAIENTESGIYTVDSFYFISDSLQAMADLIQENEAKNPPSKSMPLEKQKAELLASLDVMMWMFIENQQGGYDHETGILEDITALRASVESMTKPLPHYLRNTMKKLGNDHPMLQPNYSAEDLDYVRNQLDVYFYKDQDRMSALARIDRIKEQLEAGIIEQPEVIERLLAIERKNYRRIRRVKPEHLMLIGLPGTGKDTAAEAYVQAMFPGDEQAIDKHMYRVKIMSKQADLWSELGSATGYVGSGEFPKLLDFVIEHSGGRYIKMEEEKMFETKYYIVENPEWRANGGRNLPGTLGPESAVMFFNEMHDWSYANKNEFLKEFLEKGIIQVNNPNGGLKTLEFPATLILASNNGIELLADRHLDGRPRGQAQSYEELIKKWKTVAKNPRLLKSSIMKRPNNDAAEAQDVKGTSEEVGSRITNVLLLRPISPEGLVKITDIHLNKLAKDLRTNTNSKLGKVEVTWTPGLSKYIQEYAFNAEDAARPMGEKVKLLVEPVLDAALLDGKLTLNENDIVEIKLDVREQVDGTAKLAFEFLNSDRESFELEMEKTQEMKKMEPLADQEIQYIRDLENRMVKRVYGVESIAKKLSQRVLSMRIKGNKNFDANKEKSEKATMLGFFGKSATGKTETTKVLAEELFGDKSAIWRVDADQLKHQLDFERLFGHDFEQPDKRSEFQKEYDRHNGRMIVVLDELANVNKELIKNFYPYFDEPEIDGRRMKDVLFVITGNAGEEWYEGIPKNLPDNIRFDAMHESYKKNIGKINSQEALLRKYFSDATLTRIGMDNMYFFSPLSHGSIHKMFALKMNEMITKTFAPTTETHWWDFYFESAEDRDKVLEAMAKEGYSVEEQGRSIHRFVHEQLSGALIDSLTGRVPAGKAVKISLDAEKTTANELTRADDYGRHTKGVYLNIEADGYRDQIYLQSKAYEHYPKTTEITQVFVAYHEAGHEIVTKALLGDTVKSTGIYIIPGVADIGGRSIVYLGLQTSEELERVEKTEQAVLREMALLYGGFVAEILTSANGSHNAGKSNDMERANQLAEASILMWGNSERFGTNTVPAGKTLAEMIASLTPEQRQIFNEEKERMRQEARKMAEEAILLNWDLFLTLGKTLAEKGIVLGPELETIYENAEEKIFEWDPETKSEFNRRKLALRKGNYYRTETGEVVYSNSFFGKMKSNLSKKWQNFTAKDSFAERDAVLLHDSLMPRSVKDIDQLLEERRVAEVEKAEIMDLPLAPRFDLQDSKPNSCRRSAK
ncbi:MAG: AAA family ATPase [Bdellovibrionota bacterium]|nr:AAA family ATPase [Bdellovibrionota bacterium]